MKNTPRSMNVEIERLRALLERKDADLDRATYILSHDLRKPLRHIVGFADAFLEDYGDMPGLTLEAADYINEMVNGAKRMERLLDGILIFAKSGALDESTIVNLESIFADVLQDNAQDLEAVGGIAFVEGRIPRVVGSPRLLYQLLGNLVANSIKFHDPARPLQVCLHAHRENNRVVVCVDDNGVGIPPYLQEEAFQLFRRVGPQAQHTDGMGLGLAVCRRIVEAHGGKIHASPGHAGVGTSIRFDLTAIQT